MPRCFCVDCDFDDAARRLPVDKEKAKQWVHLSGRIWSHATVNSRFCHRHFPSNSDMPTIQFHKNARTPTAPRKDPFPRKIDKEQGDDKENKPTIAMMDQDGNIIFGGK